VCQRWVRIFVTGCLAACTVTCERPRGSPLDRAAAEYARLARLGDHRGADHLEAIEKVRRQVAAVDEQGSRRAFLLTQLAALTRRAHALAGSRPSIRDESAALGMRVPPYEPARAAALREDLERALPGTTPLTARLANHRRKHAVSRARLEDTARRAVADCQARTPVPSDLHDRGVALRYVIDTSWPAFTHYEGNGRSRVEIRRDAAWLENDLRAVMCHETYPGHHLQNIVWEQLAARSGWVELTVVPMFTPHAAMAERAAIAAVTLVFPPHERDAVSRILDELAPLALATAVETLDGSLARVQAIDRLHNDLLMPDGVGFISFVEEFRSMAVAYVTPVERVRDWPSYFELLRSHELLVDGAKQ
jgi:hypothetical protein